MSPMSLLASMASASAVLLVALKAFPPPRRLSDRVEPYLRPSLNGRNQDGPEAFPSRLLLSPVRDLSAALGRFLAREGSTKTILSLRQAGWFSGLEEQQMLLRFRLRQVRDVSVLVLGGLTGGLILGTGLLTAITLSTLGLVVGATRARGSLTKAIEQRRERLQIEIYTINQLLAMRIRAGGGVIQSVSAVVQRGAGEVVAELEEALRLHRAGWRAADAFRRIAEVTPEPFCARSYRLLAAAEEKGAELGRALLSLSEDVRETRREALKRRATKRRAAMLVPTVAILAPVLILFVAAPLPYLITNWQ